MNMLLFSARISSRTLLKVQQMQMSAYDGWCQWWCPVCGRHLIRIAGRTRSKSVAYRTDWWNPCLICSARGNRKQGHSLSPFLRELTLPWVRSRRLCAEKHKGALFTQNTLPPNEEDFVSRLVCICAFFWGWSRTTTGSMWCRESNRLSIKHNRIKRTFFLYNQKRACFFVDTVIYYSGLLL